MQKHKKKKNAASSMQQSNTVDDLQSLVDDDSSTSTFQTVDSTALSEDQCKSPSPTAQEIEKDCEGGFVITNEDLRSLGRTKYQYKPPSLKDYLQFIINSSDFWTSLILWVVLILKYFESDVLNWALGNASFNSLLYLAIGKNCTSRVTILFVTKNKLVSIWAKTFCISTVPFVILNLLYNAVVGGIFRYDAFYFNFKLSKTLFFPLMGMGPLYAITKFVEERGNDYDVITSRFHTLKRPMILQTFMTNMLLIDRFETLDSGKTFNLSFNCVLERYFWSKGIKRLKIMSLATFEVVEFDLFREVYCIGHWTNKIDSKVHRIVERIFLLKGHRKIRKDDGSYGQEKIKIVSLKHRYNFKLMMRNLLKDNRGHFLEALSAHFECDDIIRRLIATTRGRWSLLFDGLISLKNLQDAFPEVRINSLKRGVWYAEATKQHCSIVLSFNNEGALQKEAPESIYWTNFLGHDRVH